MSEMARLCLCAIQRYPSPPILFWPLELWKVAPGLNLSEPSSLFPGVRADGPARSRLTAPSLLSSGANE